MYQLSGQFIEACDCEALCPCWVDDNPDGDHCTGLFVWIIERGTIEGVDMRGRTVVSVSSHEGKRGGGGSLSVLFIDDHATDEQKALLVEAFTGQLDGPLADLVPVTGEVVHSGKASVHVAKNGKRWRVRVDEAGLQVDGAPLVFDEGKPMTLERTALSKELGTLNHPVTAQRSASFRLNLPSLPGGYLNLTERSGMRGRFSYPEAP